MAERHACNVHQGLVEDFHEVELRRAALPGPHRGFGLAQDLVVTGEVCGECLDALVALVSDRTVEGVDEFIEKITTQLRLDAVLELEAVGA